MKQKLEIFLACAVIHSSLARMAIHFLMASEHKETWDRARAGILRELSKGLHLF
jgi:hypothetical protein